VGKHADNGGHVGAFPYHVGVIAPYRFDSPGLDEAVGRSLWGLLARKRRQVPISLTTFWGEPVGRAAGVAGKQYGWPCGSMGLTDDRLEHLRSCVARPVAEHDHRRGEQRVGGEEDQVQAAAEEEPAC
jgi:hypothetical protein